jgi:hypothetical protein
MKIYQAENEEDFMDSIIAMLEQDTGKDIFTIRILGETETGLETLIVFNDKSVLMGMIHVGTVKGQLAIRMQGNFI